MDAEPLNTSKGRKQRKKLRKECIGKVARFTEVKREYNDAKVLIDTLGSYSVDKVSMDKYLYGRIKGIDYAYGLNLGFV